MGVVGIVSTVLMVNWGGIAGAQTKPMSGGPLFQFKEKLAAT